MDEQTLSRVTMGPKKEAFGRSSRFDIFLDGENIGYWYHDGTCWGIHSNSHITLNQRGEALGLKVKYRTEYGYSVRYEIAAQITWPAPNSTENREGEPK